jgi:hypothetical protein
MAKESDSKGVNKAPATGEEFAQVCGGMPTPKPRSQYDTDAAKRKQAPNTSSVK